MLLLWRHHPLLLILHWHLRQMSLLSKVGKVLLLHMALLLNALLDERSRALVCQLCVLIIAATITIVRSLSWRVVSNRWLISSFCLDGHIREV